MQILYALPFLAASAIAFCICLVFPGLRRHVITAAVAPTAFGFWSIVGVAGAMFIADAAGVGDADRFFSLIGFVYILAGVIGAWMSVLLAHAILRRLFA